MRAFLPDLLSILSPLIVGVITFYATDALTHAVRWIDALPAHLKRGLAVVIASLLTMGAKWLSIEIPTDLAVWTPDTIDAIVSAGLAMAVKAGNTAKSAKAESHVAAIVAEGAASIAEDAKQAVG